MHVMVVWLGLLFGLLLWEWGLSMTLFPAFGTLFFYYVAWFNLNTREVPSHIATLCTMFCCYPLEI